MTAARRSNLGFTSRRSRSRRRRHLCSCSSFGRLLCRSLGRQARPTSWLVPPPLRRSFPISGDSLSGRHCRPAHHPSFPELSLRGLLCNRGAISRRDVCPFCPLQPVLSVYEANDMSRMAAASDRSDWQCVCAAGIEPGIAVRVGHQRSDAGGRHPPGTGKQPAIARRGRPGRQRCRTCLPVEALAQSRL